MYLNTLFTRLSVLILISFSTLSYSQITIQPGWPVFGGLRGTITWNGSVIFIPNATHQFDVVLRTVDHVLLYNYHGQLLDTLTQNRIGGPLRGLLVPLKSPQHSIPLIATATACRGTYASGAETLIVASIENGEVFNTSFNTRGTIVSPTGYDVNNDGSDEILYEADSIYCFRQDGSSYQNFPYRASISDHSGVYTGVSIGQFTNFSEPVFVYRTIHDIHARMVGDTIDLPGFPVFCPDSEYSSRPLLIPWGSGFRIFVSRFNGQNYETSIEGYTDTGDTLFHTRIGANSIVTNLSAIDIEGDGIPEIVYMAMSARPIVIAMDGHIISDLTPPLGLGGTYSNVVGYRPPGHQTNWFFTLTSNGPPNSMDTTYLVGCEGYEMLQGFPVALPNTLPDFVILHDLALCGPINDTLYIMLQDDYERFTLFRMPMQGGGVMECQTACQDFSRTGVYRPYQVTSVSEPPTLPTDSKLAAYPNPGNATFTIVGTLPSVKQQSLTIYDLQGRSVFHAAIPQPTTGSRRFRFVWEGRDQRGIPVASGLYWCRVGAMTPIKIAVVR